jgi:hypothetical protein
MVQVRQHIGPVDIVIENNKIVQIASLGSPGIKIAESRRPVLTSRWKRTELPQGCMQCLV